MNSVKLREKLAIGFVAVDVWGAGMGAGCLFGSFTKCLSDIGINSNVINNIAFCVISVLVANLIYPVWRRDAVFWEKKVFEAKAETSEKQL